MSGAKSPSPELWQMWRRLRAAGCPIDCENLAAPDYPFRVMRPPWNLASNFFPMKDGVGIAFNLRIIAATPMTICGFRLEADWLSKPVAWVEVCTEHAGYCLDCSSGARVRFRRADVLNHRTYHAGELKGGSFLQGILVGVTASPMSPKLSQKLEATLWIEDLYAISRPYALDLQS